MNLTKKEKAVLEKASIALAKSKFLDRQNRLPYANSKQAELLLTAAELALSQQVPQLVKMNIALHTKHCWIYQAKKYCLEVLTKEQPNRNIEHKIASIRMETHSSGVLIHPILSAADTLQALVNWRPDFSAWINGAKIGDQFIKTDIVLTKDDKAYVYNYIAGLSNRTFAAEIDLNAGYIIIKRVS